MFCGLLSQPCVVGHSREVSGSLLSAGFPEERLFVVKTLQDGLAVLNALPRAEKRIVLLENDLPDNF